MVQVGHGDGRKKKSKTGEDGSYQTAGHGDGRRKKSKTEENGSYHAAQVGPGDRGRKKSTEDTMIPLLGHQSMDCPNPYFEHAQSLD